MSASQNKIYTYFERNPELKVLFIFNNPFLKEEISVDTWREDFRYVVFQGDWFTTKYNLDNEWENCKVVLYFDQESPLKSKELMTGFPLMDVLTANMEYHQQDYAAFMQQYGIPQQMATFIERNIMQLESDKMMNLLKYHYDSRTINEDIAVRAFISNFMGQQKVLSWDDIIIRMILQGRESERNKQIDFYKKLEANKSIKNPLVQHLTDIFGVSYELNTEAKVGKIVQVLKYNAIVQNLAPVAGDNYKSMRITDTVALQQINRIMEMALGQSKTAPLFLEVLETLGSDVHDADIIEWYGTDANYNFIPDGLCIPIIKKLMETHIADDPQIVIERVEDLMIKHGENSELSIAMDYALLVARFYERALSLGSLTLNTPEEYVLKYEGEYYMVDQLYRLATESYYKISPSSVLFDSIQTVKKALDVHYAKLANRMNYEWLRCVKDAGGLSGLHQLRQQDFYDTMIKPMQKKVAVIVSDALRYEVAQAMVAEIAKSKHVAKLNMALAMLPTETKYCKPALLPHKSLKLYNEGDELDMSVDNKILDTREKRTQHLDSYKEGAICVPFSEVAKYNQDKNREIFKHPIVYIFHNSIDELGHDAPAKQVVNNCAQAIKDIATMVSKIHSSYNVTEVYVTADHGFLFNDMEFADKDKQKVTEDALEKKSRYYITKSDAKVTDIIKFPLDQVSGIGNAGEMYVAVPIGTNRLSASGGYVFAHGGASLQELIIPVIVSRQERSDTKQPVGVMVLDRKLSITASRLRFKLLQTDAVNMEMKERVITVALYNNDKPVTTIKQILLDKTDPSLDNRKIAVDLTLNTNVDAKVLQLKVYDVEDDMNPIFKENVTNNTLIENDFDF